MATPGGIAPIVDKASLDECVGDTDTLTTVRTKFEALEPFLAEPLNLDDAKVTGYDVVFHPAGTVR